MRDGVPHALASGRRRGATNPGGRTIRCGRSSSGLSGNADFVVSRRAGDAAIGPASDGGVRFSANDVPRRRILTGNAISSARPPSG